MQRGSAGDKPSEQQLMLFLHEVLNRTAAFQAVQGTVPFLQMHYPGRTQTHVHIVASRVALGENYYHALDDVLTYLEHYARTPEAKECAAIWRKWSNLLDARSLAHAVCGH